MKISTKSWHYRLMDWVDLVEVYNRTNLCSYIRGLLITILIPLGLILAPVALYIFSVYFAPHAKEAGVYESLLGVFFALWGIIGTVIDGIIIIALGHEYYSDNVKPRLPKLFEEKPKKPKQPNIFVEYLKAKKQKICPRIEFVEES